MASAIIHMCVAKKVNDYLDTNLNELLLGSIAPDLSKQIGENKNKTHFITSIEDIPNINLFLDKYRDNLKTPFDVGYFIHLYTDKIWYSTLYKDIIKNTSIDTINKLKLEKKEDIIKKLFYKDYTNLNIILIDKYNLDLSLFYEDFILPKTCILEIDVDKLNILIDKMGIIIENSKNYEVELLDYNKVLNFIDNVSNDIINILKGNNE